MRTNDIDGALAAALDLGEVLDMSRGTLSWKIAVRPDGALLEGGLVPTIIQWPEGPHPSGNMADLGVRLAGLDVFHPEPERLRGMLAEIGAAGLCDVKAAGDGGPYFPGILFSLPLEGGGSRWG